ncbi:uncharacterized protein LOC134225845 [Armigeres subalbatus]|uniref:uncharacterized protein LOC134225845 n=1 Tax=Armigeres subalbatus TaxID=124917 RepID=UPI002ED5BF29
MTGNVVADAEFNLMPNKAKQYLPGDIDDRGMDGNCAGGSYNTISSSPRNRRTKETPTMRSFIGMLLGLLTISDSLALRLKTVHIPPYKLRGESALLQCQYELKGQQTHNGYSNHNNYHSSHQQQRGRPWNDTAGGFRHHVYHDHDYYSDSETGEERLYSIKWYKDNEEFYRYVPSANQPIKSYKIEGIRVDPNHSDGTKVMLKTLTLKSSGVYRCEISAEAPNFDSVQGEGRMDVIYLPKDGPHINGSEKRSYHIGESMELNCTSGRSYPASTLQWYLNDKLVMDPRSIVHYPRMVNQHGLLTSFLGLNMVVQPQHYIDGSMKLKCVANLSPVLWRNGQESIMQWEQPPLDNRVAMLLVRSGSSRRVLSSVVVLLWYVLLVIISTFRLHP